MSKAGVDQREGGCHLRVLQQLRQTGRQPVRHRVYTVATCQRSGHNDSRADRVKLTPGVEGTTSTGVKNSTPQWAWRSWIRCSADTLIRDQEEVSPKDGHESERAKWRVAGTTVVPRVGRQGNERLLGRLSPG